MITTEKRNQIIEVCSDKGRVSVLFMQIKSIEAGPPPELLSNMRLSSQPVGSSCYKP